MFPPHHNHQQARAVPAYAIDYINDEKRSFTPVAVDASSSTSSSSSPPPLHAPTPPATPASVAKMSMLKQQVPRGRKNDLDPPIEMNVLGASSKVSSPSSSSSLLSNNNQSGPFMFSPVHEDLDVFRRDDYSHLPRMSALELEVGRPVGRSVSQ